jgi:hypothetical protein
MSTPPSTVASTSVGFLASIVSTSSILLPARTTRFGAESRASSAGSTRAGSALVAPSSWAKDGAASRRSARASRFMAKIGRPL